MVMGSKNIASIALWASALIAAAGYLHMVLTLAPLLVAFRDAPHAAAVALDALPLSFYLLALALVTGVAGALGWRRSA